VSDAQLQVIGTSSVNTESSMKQPSDLTHITPSDGNVFADLGFDADEAIALQDWSQEIIKKKLRRLKAPRDVGATK
jgi:hypothetical protein